MFSKLFCKKNIRRAVPGTCLVAGGTGAGAPSPAKVTLTLQLRGGCWRTTSRKVAVFTFQEASGHASSHALLDLEYLFRCSSKPGASDMQVKICVALRRGGKRVARADLGEFLGQLTRGGRLDSFFLYIHEEKVALLQANQPAPCPATEWLLEGAPRGTHTNTCIEAEAEEENYDIDELENKYTEWKAYLEEVFSVEEEDKINEVEDNSDDKYTEWKADLEEVFTVEDIDDQALNEVTPEVQEASDNGAAGQVTPEVQEASDNGAAGHATPEVQEASDNGAAGQATPEVQEASDNGAAGHATPEVQEASDNGAAGQATPEVQEASDNGAAGQATPEVQEASGAGSEAAHAAPSAVEEAAQNDPTAADEDVPHQGECSSAVTVPATPSPAGHAYRSLAVPHRFISRLAGPEDRHLEDLRRSYGVQITRIKRTLHVKGRRDAVLQCHHSLRAKIAEWRRSEAAEAH